jgi:hypothetical protein
MPYRSPYAVTIIRSSKLRAGNSNNQNQVSWYGPARPA